jgi:hypothetical protein
MTPLIARLVDRFGRTGFAALTSLGWALPMAAWAGSADLSPIDKTAYPWIALAIGVVMLVAWLVLLTRLATVRVTPRRRRLDLSTMSQGEKRWALACFAFSCGAIAWLNAAATVDWAPLVSAAASGKPAPALVAAALGILLVGMLAGVAISWRKWSGAFARRP